VIELTPGLRKLALTAHVIASVGWLGAVLAYLALSLAGLRGQDGELARAAYQAMDLVGWRVVVPCALASLVSGLIQALGTPWGLFRHYWIVAKLGLTTVGTAVLLGHMRTVGRMAQAAAASAPLSSGWDFTRTQLVVHAAGGLLILLIATILSIHKPWGKTPYGRRQSPS
jgi:hypothetical protein